MFFNGRFPRAPLGVLIMNHLAASRLSIHFLAITVLFCLPVSPSIGQGAGLKYQTFRGVSFEKHDNVDLMADIYMPLDDGPHAGVLLIHGGGWLAGDRSELRSIARKMAPLGYTVMAIDYRLAPKDKFPAQIEDCNAAISWMVENAAKYKIDPKRLGVWGYSSGGHLAALLGTTNPLI